MKIIRTLCSFTIKIWLLLWISIAYCQETKTIDSLKFELQKFEAHKRELGNRASKMLDTVKVKILSQIVSKTFKVNPLDALPYVTEELEISERINYKWGISHAHNIFGVINNYNGDQEKAIYHFKKALKGKQDIKDEAGEIEVHVNFGVFYSKNSDYKNALEHLFKALELSKKIKDNNGVLAAYNNIGVIYLIQKKYDEALDNYQNCIQLLFLEKKYFYVSSVYQNIGDIYCAFGEFDTAASYFKKGIQFAKEYGNIESLANNHDGLGKVFLANKDYENAIDHFSISLNMRREKKDVWGIHYSYMHLGEVYYQQKQYKKAILNINRGIDGLSNYGDINAVAKGHEMLAEMYGEMGVFKLAYKNHVLFKQIKDSIFNIESKDKLAEVELTYKFKIIQDSIKDVQKQKDILQKEELKSQKRSRNSIFAIMAVIVIALILLIIQRNRISAIKKQQALEEERKRISRNLHDDLGAQLSAVRMFISSIKNQKDKEKIKETVDNSLGLLDSSIQELRNIMDDIHSSVLKERGYLEATVVLVNKINQLNVIKFSLTSHNLKERFDARIEHELYRVTQELINNTLKYAEAENVSIDVLKRNGNLVFMYEDDGKGFDLEMIEKGNGLDNIESRIKSIKGSVTIDTGQGIGARTIIEIPL